MKYVVLSFDDGKKDFYTRALPILKKYNIPAVLNVVSDAIKEKSSKDDSYVSWEDLRECLKNGIEIANHSANHSNTPNDIVRGAKEIRQKLNIAEKIGFASPNSGVCKLNFEEYQFLLKSSHTEYVRSGNRLTRDGYWKVLQYMIYKYTKSQIFYYRYNKRNIILKDKNPVDFFPSVTCNRDNSIKQVLYLIKKMPQESKVILMYHSIFDKSDVGYKKNKWSNTIEDFEVLCKTLSSAEDISVVTNHDLCKIR